MYTKKSRRAVPVELFLEEGSDGLILDGLDQLFRETPGRTTRAKDRASWHFAAPTGHQSIEENVLHASAPRVRPHLLEDL
jgi:hypothetical protein